MKSLVYCAPPRFHHQYPSLPPFSSPQISIKQVSGYLSSMVSPALPPTALAELQQQFLTMAAAHAKDIPEKDVQVRGLQLGFRETGTDASAEGARRGGARWVKQGKSTKTGLLSEGGKCVGCKGAGEDDSRGNKGSLGHKGSWLERFVYLSTCSRSHSANALRTCCS